MKPNVFLNNQGVLEKAARAILPNLLRRQVAQLSACEIKNLVQRLEKSVLLLRGFLRTIDSDHSQSKHPQPVKMDHAGLAVEKNIWFKIGLSKDETKMVKAIVPHILSKKFATSARAVRCLVQGTLAHYDKLEPLMFQDAAYAQREGFSSMNDFYKKIIARQHAQLTKQ
jgi:hypothetical protein